MTLPKGFGSNRYEPENRYGARNQESRYKLRERPPKKTDICKKCGHGKHAHNSILSIRTSCKVCMCPFYKELYDDQVL